MESLESELSRARALDVGELTNAIESIGFECTHCGACCRSEDCASEADETDVESDAVDGEGDESIGDGDPHTATVFPDEVRRLQERGEYDWRDVARPMPYGLDAGDTGDVGDRNQAEGASGTTFEWALQTDDCGDCTFYEEPSGEGTGDDGGGCTVHEDRPLICRTYPFSVALGGTSQPMGEPVDGEGIVRAHECEGLGRDMDRDDAEELAKALKERAIRELEEAIGVRENYEPVTPAEGDIVVHDSEGAKRADGTRHRGDERDA